MAVIWLVPSILLVGACLLLWRWQQQIDHETEQLRTELRRLPVLADRARAVRRQAERTAGATDATSTYADRSRLS